jgi:hypothetical protein
MSTGFKQTAIHYEFAVGDPKESADEGFYTDRRIRLVLGPARFWYAIVDRFYRVIAGVPTDKDVERFQSPKPHAYIIESHEAETVSEAQLTARKMMRWVRYGELHGASAAEAAWDAFWVLEVQPVLVARGGTWLQTWAPGWWGMLEPMFGEFERKRAAKLAGAA